MVKLQQTQVKIFCVALALVFIGSVVALGLSQLGTSTASAASSSVGVVDYRKAMMLQQKEQDLLAAIQKKLDDAVKQVAEAKGLSVVLDKNAVVYGGQDITDDVMKKFK